MRLLVICSPNEVHVFALSSLVDCTFQPDDVLVFLNVIQDAIGEPMLDVTLRQGDLLYFPRGTYVEYSLLTCRCWPRGGEQKPDPELPLHGYYVIRYHTKMY
jgi:hypothetical protein